MYAYVIAEKQKNYLFIGRRVVMKKKIMDFICKYGCKLCAAAVVIAPLASEACKVKYYQPEEPAGLRDFAMKK